MRCNAVCLFEAQTIGIRQPLKSACPSTANKWCSTPMPKRKAMISSVSAAWIFPKDGRWMLYGTDTSGDERYDFRIRSLETGKELPEVFKGIGGACFTPDAQWVFYVKLGDAWRPYAVMRHRVGTPIVDDVEVYCEQDERFWVGIGLSFDERNLVIGTGSKTTTEVLLLSTDDPEGEFRAFIPREQDVEYDVSFSRFEGAGECGEDIPLAVVYHNALNPNFEIDVIDMRSHEPPVPFG